MTVRSFVIDKWSNLSHKMPLRDDPQSRAVSSVNGWRPQSWVSPEHQRRITGYVVLASYLNNVSRRFLETTDPKDISDRREYGDAALVRDEILSALLGDDQVIQVLGAERYDPELGTRPPVTVTNPDGTTTTTQPEQPTDDELAANEAARFLAERQDFLQGWARGCHFELRLTDCETNTVGLGDGVWLLGWDPKRQQVVPAVFDPGFYFPVLEDTLDSYEYPTRVHFAWELPGEDFSDEKDRVRRITYELVELDSLVDVVDLPAGEDGTGGGPQIVDPADTERIVVTEGEFTREQVVRRYPWAIDEPSPMTCVVTDATWIVENLQDANQVDSFDLDHADIAVDGDGNLLDEHDLGIDFLPVVHVPNTPPGGDHYGESSIARVLQILDDLQNGDTDAQAAAATTGSPITWSSGKGGPSASNPLLGTRGEAATIAPGAHWPLGEGGTAGTIDTAGNLAATREYVTHLLNRMATNSRLPAAILGLLKPSEVPSGITLKLSFGPLESMIRQMRMVRDVKYPLLLKMTQRITQVNAPDLIAEGPTPEARLQLGSFLPQDQAGTLTTVATAYAGHLISLETAVRMLVEVGFPIDDIAEEIARIQSRNFQAANDLADATGDSAEVRKFLGLDPTPEVPTTAPLPIA